MNCSPVTYESCAIASLTCRTACDPTRRLSTRYGIGAHGAHFSTTPPYVLRSKSAALPGTAARLGESGSGVPAACETPSGATPTARNTAVALAMPAAMRRDRTLNFIVQACARFRLLIVIVR